MSLTAGWIGLRSREQSVKRAFTSRLGGSPSKGDLHLSGSRGPFDRLVNRRVAVLKPAASVKGVEDQAMEGKTPETSIDRHGSPFCGPKAAPADGRQADSDVFAGAKAGGPGPRPPLPPRSRRLPPIT